MFSDLKQNSLILTPGGDECFGTIGEASKFELREGGIFLRAGAHFGPNKGFGVRHIWEAHKADLQPFGCESIEQVSAFVASVVTVGSLVYCEFNDPRGNHRVTILRNKLGSLILEPRDERHRGFGYYVVTWYPSNRPKGTLVSKVF